MGGCCGDNRKQKGESRMAVTEDLEAIALEEEDPLQHEGEEANPPSDSGRPPAEEGIDPAEQEQPDEELPPEEVPTTGEEAPGAWRAAGSLLALRREIDARWPNRDRRTDGMVGDLDHCPRDGSGTSDHCPNAQRVVRAFDIDSDGIPANWLAEHFRKLGASGDPRLAGNGYVIFNRRIASAVRGWVWRRYNGSSPHTDHIHLSLTRDAGAYDRAGLWGTKQALLPRHEVGSRTLQLKEPMMRGTDVKWLQRFLGVDTDGVFGPKTKQGVVNFQRRRSINADGVVEQTTWQALRAV